MPARFLLASTSLAPRQITIAAGRLTRGLASGAIVTTAEIKLKGRSHNAILAHTAFAALGVAQLEFFDLDKRPASDLARFDFVYLAGGNPFYLLRRLRETEADSMVEEIAASGRPVIGSGAGAVVLGRTIRPARLFDSSVPDLGWKDDSGLGLVPFALVPYANRWKARFADYPRRVEAARAQSRCDVEELEDGEGILVESGAITRVGDHTPPAIIPAA